MERQDKKVTWIITERREDKGVAARNSVAFVWRKRQIQENDFADQNGARHYRRGAKSALDIQGGNRTTWNCKIEHGKEVKGSREVAKERAQGMG